MNLATRSYPPSAGGGNSADAPACVANAAGVAHVGAESTGPAQPTGVSFCCAYWDYLRRLTTEEPLAAEYGLEEPYAEVLRRQCAIEFTNQAVAAARAAATFQSPSQRSAR